MAWKFFKAPENASELSGSHRSAVSRLNLIQDYQEGGQRCQDIKTVARSLYQHQIGCLVAPSNHKGIDIVMSWVNKAYGHLRMGRRLLHSLCDFLALPQETPNHWRLALKAHGTLRALVPYDGSPEAQNERTPETIYRYAESKGARTMHVGGHWSLGRVLIEPLFYHHTYLAVGSCHTQPGDIRTRTETAQRSRSIRAKNLLLEPGTRHRCQKGLQPLKTLRRTRPHSHRPLP